MLNRFNEGLQELTTVRTEVLQRSERQVVALVLAIAERVVHRELTLDRQLLVGMARASLDRLGDCGPATVTLHPDDFNAIGAARLPADVPVKVAADPSVPPGGCFVQSDFGFMDVSPDAQFRELARTLLADADVPPADAPATHVLVLK